MPKYIPLTYEQMDEYLEGLAINYDLYPGNSDAYGMTKKQALAKAKEEKETLPEEDWSISTLLTEWDKMYQNHPQLRDPDTFSTESGVMGKISALASYTRNFYPMLADNILGGKETNVGKHKGFLYLYGMMAGIKEEKWAEMPEFAHYAKVLLRKCNLPLPVPRKDVPTRADAERNYIDAIDVNQQPEKNLDAMLGILAVDQKFREGEALFPYEEHPSTEKKNQKLKEMFTVDAHPILTAATVFELRQNKELMAFLDTPEAVKAAKAGKLPEQVKLQVTDRVAAAKAKEEQEERERQSRAEVEQRQAEKKANRGRAVQARRSESLRDMLTRLGVSEADLNKNPKDLKLSGSKEYNNMARAALEAYQSASGSGVYDIDLDKKVREACFAYTKGKKSVRAFESGRKRFDACLELMMSVSEPNEKGELPEGIQAQFDRINAVRKTKVGDYYYVSPDYYKFSKNQLTLLEAREKLDRHEALYDMVDGKKTLNTPKYNYVMSELKKHYPTNAEGRIIGSVVVEADTFRYSYGPDRGKTDLIAELAQAYEVEKTKKREEAQKQQKKALEDEKEVQERKLQEQREWAKRVLADMEREKERIRNMTPEEKKKYDEDQKAFQKMEEEEYKKIAAEAQAQYEKTLNAAKEAQDKLMEAQRIKTDKDRAKNEALADTSLQTLLETGLLEMKQAKADAYADQLFHSKDECEYRKTMFDSRQLELREAWKYDFFSLETEGAQKRYAQARMNELRAPCGAVHFYNKINAGWYDASGYLGALRRLETLKKEKKEGLELSMAQNTVSNYDKKRLESACHEICGAFACITLFRPDEKVNKAQLEAATDTLYHNEAMRTALLSAEKLKKEKALYEQSEAMRREDTTQIYYKGAMPKELHKARNLAISIAVAGRISEKLFTDPNAEPDMKKLLEESNRVIRSGDFMAEVADKEVDPSLMNHITKSCNALFEPPVQKAQENVKKEEPKQVDAKPKADLKKNNKKNNNKKSGMGL